MTSQEVIDEIRLELTGNLLETEIDDNTFEQIVKKALREIERFWDETKVVTVPFTSCIDLSGFNSSAIVKVYRAEAYGDAGSSQAGLADPMFAQQWMLFSNGGTMYNLNDYILNYSAWASLLQIKNTISTDMAFKEDKQANKLYINHYLDIPQFVTIEYIPKLTDTTEIKSDYWIDMLVKFSLAISKVVLGRIRTRFTQSSSLWTQDGETLLTEGNTELKELRDTLRANDNLIFGVD